MWKLFILFLFPFVKSQSECFLKSESNVDIEWDEFKDNVLGSFEETVPIGTVLPGIITEGAKFKSIVDASQCNYFQVSQFNDTYMLFETKSDFADWDGKGISECKFTIKFDLSLCTKQDADEINFSYTIIDVNSNEPVFNINDLNIKVAFPIAPGVSLNKLNDLLIETIDNDFSTQSITYTIDGGSEDFILAPLPKSGTHFPVSLQTGRLVNLQKPVVLTITATDDGTNPGALSTKANITITPDLDNSIPPKPELTETLYEGDVKWEELKAGFALQIDISLKDDYNDVILTLNDDSFAATLSGKTVSVTLTKDIEQDDRQSITVILTATIKYTSYTAQTSSVILLQFSEDNNSSTSTTSTTASTGESTHTPSPNTTPPPSGNDDDPDSGLVAATIIFALTTAILLGIVGYGYYKYVHKKSVITPTSQAFQRPGSKKVVSSGGSNIGLENEKTKERKVSRKRSMTFTEDDEVSRANRENSVDVESAVQKSL